MKLHHSPPRPSVAQRSNPSWLLVAALLFPSFLHAQTRDHEVALSEKEVEILRDRAPDAPERVKAFIVFLDDRTKAIDKAITGHRKAGREEDIHDLMEEFTSIANDLIDNLEDYDKRHKDMRKALPKLLAATDRWATTLRTPADQQAYNVSRKLALEALAEVKSTATELVTTQQTYFIAHPPPKDDGKKNEEGYRGPPL